MPSILLQKSGERGNEEMKPKWKQCPVVDMYNGERKSDAVKNNIA